ncbi:amino acid adenylation domain-containing protein [Myxococcus sp. CA033]|uniref:non-ribosomal peptide synthetase n=1 Tax=Myxococcus sp. CA033 TaxID=2741516 RepID=UPI00157B9DD2|nr:non-ribosomal peptide synthetase [Myxococcus sp. CA033]NTX38935.1 amino acid adenylation domain-containing protein [Myxococcus sp. CA033]
MLDALSLSAPSPASLPSNIADAFEAQVALRPHAVAVSSDSVSLTYAGLDARANQLAWRLRAQGIGREHPQVGVCLPRSAELLVTLLAIVKAGGAYVPLDPDYPSERLRLMAEDAGVHAIVTQTGLRSRLPSGGVPTLCLDALEAELDALPAHPPKREVCPDDLAYVVFTSGSTGKPKGVCVPHRGVLRLVLGANYVDVGPDDVLLQLAPVAFDASTFEIWGALLNGARLAVFTQGAAGLDELGPFLEAQGVTVVWVTTGLFHQLVELGLPGMGRVRELLTGGEVLSVPHARKALEQLPHIRLVNFYGPTENTTFTSFHPMRGALETDDTTAVAIGRAISGTRMYVLDEALRPVPVGTVGELYTGGLGLAWGYWERADLTGERFLPDPWSDTPGGRMYRTGDLVRRRVDGVMEFIGRRDHQVKLRGFRIELGEVESALRQHSSVLEALALVREDLPGDRRLVAYVVARASSVELREHVQRLLPGYMVPAAIVVLDALPLTPNGKVDRALLPTPQAHSEDFIAPESALETAVARIWAEVLGMDAVSATANFFDLGGHSLLATQVVTRMREETRFHLPLRALFDQPVLRELCARLEETPSAFSEDLIRPAQGEARLSPSFAQQRLWFLDRWMPDTAVYSLPMAFRLEGPLDVTALEQSLQALVDRHESLRTTFPGEGAPVQLVAESVSVRLERSSVSSVEQAHALLRAAAERPFDLARGPLFRALLVTTAAHEHEHLLLLNLHHIIADGWSFGVLYQELSAEYLARLQGVASSLAPLSIQYADFSSWQRHWLSGDTLSSQLSFWTRLLDGVPHVLSLPSDFPRPSLQSFEGSTHRFSLPLHLRDSLDSLSRLHGATLFMALLSSFQLLLSRYSGQLDFLVGSPIANRTRPQLESLIGFFVNTLPLPARLSGNPSFLDVLLRTRDSCLGAYSHQELPFEKLVEELHVEREPGRSPLVQVLFALQNAPGGQLQLPGLQVAPLDLETRTSRFELFLALEESPEGLRGSIEYSTALFAPHTIERMAEHFVRLVEAFVREPERPCGQVPILSDDEQRQWLIDWNHTARAYPSESSLVRLFNAQVALRPEAVAVRQGERALTYAQLDSRANALAQVLRAQGVNRRHPQVGVCLPRSPELIVAFLASLKAGGAYVPLDPEHPTERLAFMAHDARLAAIVSHDALSTRLPEGPWHVVNLDRLGDALEGSASTPWVDDSTADDLAHIIYTSGSTGRPKGVCIPHRGVVRMALDPDQVRLGPDDRVAQVTTVTFDLSTLEIWGALLNGAALVIFDKDEVIQPDVFARHLREERISALVVATAIFHHTARTHPDAFAGLRWVIFGGEAADATTVQRVLTHGAPVALVNGYGPTENTTYSTWYQAQPSTELSVPIGRPVSNSTAYVLDANLQPVPRGVAGELFVGGDGLAWGYWDRPDLTAERFIPHPFSTTPGARLYRTGDLVRFRQDGELDFIGRRDNQVKLRGFRIELGEVEAALRAHPAVRDAVVLVREDSPGDKRLVAYVVTRSSGTLLREHLGQQLPSYMVPSAVVVLDALPLTPNGKVDRRALPAPEFGALETDSFVAPRTELESRLAAIWAAVLQLDSVSVTANFFDLGGHSLLATQVISRIQEHLGTLIPVRALFEAPSIEALARVVEQRRNDVPAPTDVALVPTVSRDAPLPLSFAQERLWFLSQLHEQQAVYNMPFALRLEGALDVAALHDSLRALVLRHEALRTHFPGDGVPSQHISDSLDFDWELVDLSSSPNSDDEALRLLQLDAEAPFNLALGPLFRARLFLLAPQRHLLLLNLHHIISDGWSFGVLYQELSAEYLARLQGVASPLPPLSIQYADFSSWQRHWLSGDPLSSQLSFWTRLLDGVPHVLSLPSDFPRPSLQSFEGSTHRFSLPLHLRDSLDSLSRLHGATLFMALLSSFQLLLSRYSGQLDFLVGSPIANRTRPQLESLIGFFVNTLPLPARLSGNPSFIDVLLRTRDSCLGAYSHQELPFEKLVEELHVQRSLSHGPLVQVMFALQNAPGAPPSFPALSVEHVELHPRTSKFDLTLSLEESSDGLHGVFEFATALFAPATVARMADHLRRLMEQVVRTPHVSIHSLDLLSADERRQWLVEWNDTGRPYPAHSSIVECFATQAALRPDAIAVQYGSDSLSYGELDARSNQLARILRAHGIGRARPQVGVCLPRSPELIVTLLAILKAGGAYVPLDPDYPSERLDFMARDAQVVAVVTHESRRESVPSGDWRLLSLDLLREALSANSKAPLECDLGPDDLAHILYTSGSMGRPKGVCIPHRGVLRLVLNSNDVQLGPDDRVAQAATVAFDASTFEIWGALLNGAALVILEKDDVIDPAVLARRLRDERISALVLTTSLFNLVSRSEPSAFSRLRFVLIGGENADPSCINRVLSSGPPQRLVNGYGPTENTTASTWHPTLCHQELSVPIGRPIANSTAYVLDVHLQPVPMGVTGELFVGGDGLAWGYWNKPDLTAERFIPHPFSEAPGARLYRTGDLVRLRTDGALDFIGRRDNQVKLRGFRIELGEVESAIRAHPDVRDAVVLVREDSPGDKRLVAYVATELAGSVLREHLGKQLPSHMVPSTVIVLAELPLTPNGKIDHRALPAPEANRVDGEAFVAPRTELESQLAVIWAVVLQLDKVSVTATFFDLGGHSLLATQIISRSQERLGVPLAVRMLFEAPTIESFAQAVDQRLQSAQTVQNTSLISTVSRDAPLPLSFAQERLWFLNQFHEQQAVYNMPFALRLEGALDVAALHDSLRTLVLRHESLRTRFPGDGEPSQRISDAPDFDWGLIDLSSSPNPDDEVLRLLQLDAEAPFNLALGPLFRAHLFLLAPQRHLLLLNLHHIISDGWSFGVLYQELSAEYLARLQGVASSLAPLSIQYADFSSWQRHWLSGDTLSSQLSFWTRLLDGVPHVLSLPTDFPRPSLQSFEGSTHRFSLPLHLRDSLDALSRLHGATLFMALLSSFQLLLSRYSGQLDFLVGSPIANRTRPQLESLIGFFVNTLPLPARLSGNPSFLDVLLRTRDSCLGAYSHQELPFEKLVEELHVQRSLSHGPLVQVMFALQNAPAGQLQLPGLVVDTLELHPRTSKFDLTLSLEETPHGLNGVFEFATALFTPATISRMADHLRGLMEQVVRTPHASIHSLELLSTDERRQWLVEWNDTGRPYPAHSSIVERFATQAALRPDAIAVQHGSDSLSYGELDMRSTRLARILRAQGVDRARPQVGVCLPRSPELIVTLLAILKAGGAYVPLDPDYPSERLDFMARDSQVQRIVTQTSLSVRVPHGDIEPLCIDALPPVSDDELPRLTHDMGPDDLAYVTYTSGSTGRPKGVCIPHRAVLRLVLDSDYVQLGHDDRVAQAATVAFDASTFEIWGALLNGSSLVILDKDDVIDPSILSRRLLDERISALFLTTALFNLVSRSEPSAFSRLRFLLFGGENADTSCVNRVLSLGPPQRLLHVYGPTENTTFSSWHPVLLHHELSVPIGRPIANSTAYVLDVHLRPVPTGVTGELFVGGDGLAWGYWDRADLTAERFIPHPFSSAPGARLYRTGDLVRLRHDGALDFIGRRDNQVKLRGFRIELGEVESALRSHPDVRDAIVLVREDTPGDRRLVGYVATELELTSTVLRTFLQGTLPSHMVPSDFVVLPSLPLTANGKVDHRALPRPSAAGDDSNARVAPRTPLEEDIASLWAQVLGRESISVTASFFDLGGHSLLAAQLVAKLSERFGFKVPLQVLFQSPTVAALASWVQDKLTPGELDTAPALPDGIVLLQRGRDDLPPLLCMHPIGGTVFCYQDLVRALGPERSVYGFQAPGVNGECEPLQTIEQLASVHLNALLQLRPRPPYYLVGLSMGGTIVYDMAQTLRRLGVPPSLLVFLDTPGPGQLPKRFEDDAELLAATFGDSSEALISLLRGLDPQAQMLEVLRRARDGAVVPDSFSLVDLQVFLSVWKAHMRALFSYEPSPTEGTAIYLRAQEYVPPHPRHPERPWQELVKGGLELIGVPGNHQTMIEPPQVTVMARHLNDFMRRIEEAVLPKSTGT